MIASSAKTYAKTRVSTVHKPRSYTYVGTAASKNQRDHQDHISPGGDGHMRRCSDQTRVISGINRLRGDGLVGV